MLQTLKTLSRHSLIYGLGGGLNKLLAFILLPIFTRYLTPADYGLFSLLLVTGGVAGIITQLGLGSALFREVIYFESDERTATSTALYFLIGESLLVFGGLAVLAGPLSQLIFGSTLQTESLRLVFYTGILRVMEIVFMARLRIKERAALYSTVSVARFLVGAGLSILYIAVLKQGVSGLIVAGLIQAGIFAGVYLVILLPDLRPTLSRPVLRSMLLFGAPMVPAGLADLVMVSSDRYFLQHYASTTEVGLYSLGYTIGMVMNLAVWSVQLAWPAQMFSIAKQKEAPQQFARILTYYVVVLGFLGLGLSLLARELLVIMTTPEFYGAAAVVPLVAVSYIFYGVRYMTNMALTTRDKMKYVPLIIILAALVNLGLNLLLIPPYGMLGAAWATFFSYLLLAVVSTAVNLHFWSMPYEYVRLAKVTLAWLAIYGLSLAVPATNPWVGAGLKGLLLLLGFPIFLWVLRFFDQQELARVRTLLGGRFGWRV
ncbi:MAG: oligosaccharide flippase family protein [Candidatus Neomarinimicrobiota bacterium]